MGMFMAIVKSDIFVDFRSPYVDTPASCYVSLQISIKLRETFRKKTKKRCAAQSRDLDMLYIYEFPETIHFLGFFR